MGKKIPCDWFGEGEFLYFNIMRLAEFEKTVGRPLQRLLFEGYYLDDLFVAYEIALRHEKKRSPQFYIDRIQHLVEKEGLTISDLTLPIQKALVASGVAGKQAYYALFPEELTEEEDEELKAEEEVVKN